MRLALIVAGAALAFAPPAALAQQKPAVAPAPPQATAAPAPQAFNPMEARRITAEDLKARLDANEKVIIIDTRSKFSGPMAKGAQHVPLERVEAWAKDVPKDAFIVAYCT